MGTKRRLQIERAMKKRNAQRLPPPEETPKDILPVDDPDDNGGGDNGGEDDLPPQNDPDEEFQEVADGINADVSTQLQEWIARKNVTDVDIKVYLYKYYSDGKKKQVNRFINTFPDEHTIGITHGAGKYLLLATYPKHKGRNQGVFRKDFELDDYYNTLKATAEQNPAFAAQNPALRINSLMGNPFGVPSPSRPQNDGSSQLLEIFKLVLPLLMQRNEPRNNVQEMMQQYGMMTAVMRQSLMDNAAFMRTMQERFLDEPEEEEEIQNNSNQGGSVPMIPTEEKPKTWIDQILPFAMPFIQKMAGQSPAEQSATAAIVNSIPEVKEILTNPRHKTDCKSLIDYMDKHLKSPEKVDGILKALNIDRANYQ